MADEELMELKPPPAPEVPPEVVPQRARQIRIPNTFSSLRHRNFQLYFGGQLISVAGTWMQIIAQGWLVYELSHSERTLGVVGFAAAIPALVVSPWGGVIVDRVTKRTLLVITQAAAMILAFILAALAFTNTVQVWHIIVLAAGLGLVNAFDGPARQAFLVDMVGHEDMTNAIALQSVVFNGARVIGPAIGGLLYALVGASWCFFINGVSYLAVIAGLLLMQVTPHPHPHPSASPWQQLTSGLRYVAYHKQMLGLLLLALIFSIFGISYSTVMPAFVDKILHQDSFAFGFINAAVGLGAVTGGFVLARWGNTAPRGRWLLYASIGFPILLLGFAYTPFYILSLILSFGLGVGFMLEFVLINMLLQVHVEDDMRGRVLSLYTLTFFGFSPFGQLAIGSLAEEWGISFTISLSALITLVLCGAVLLLIPHVRKLK